MVQDPREQSGDLIVVGVAGDCKDGLLPVGQTLHKHAFVDLALLLVLERLVYGHRVPGLYLRVLHVALVALRVASSIRGPSF